MPARVALVDHLRAIGAATGRMTAAALAVGPQAPVPTCPDWTVADLLAHQGLTHRWAHAHVTATEPPFAAIDEVLAEVDGIDLPRWLAAGSEQLVDALRDAPADLEAFVFLETTLSPLDFWARRQAHETTVHAMDAVCAADGGVVPASTMGLAPSFAADGLDELLVEFLTRGRSKLFAGTPYCISVEPDDIDVAWSLQVTDDALTTQRTRTDDAEVHLHGTAAALYLGLWNRGDEIVSDGTVPGTDTPPLELWRARHRIRSR